MSTTITTPKATIPIGIVTLPSGQRLEVQQHPEMVRYFFDLVRRVGGTTALTNTDLEAMAQALIDAGAVPLSSPEAQEALRGVEELRQELASLRGEADRIRGEVDELRAQIEVAPTLQPLAQRVQQIEDRIHGH